MRFSKKNLRSVEDSAIKFGLSETQEARFPRADLGAEQTGINFLRVSHSSVKPSPTATESRKRSTLSFPGRAGSSSTTNW